MQNLISIIMSVYNEDEIWIKKCIDSILNQSYENFEFLIVIDNPENTQIVNIINIYANKDNRIRVIYNEKNIGLIKSLNKALTESKGEYIARMDADDISVKDRLEKQVIFLDKNKDIDFISSKMIRIDENDNVISRDNVNYIKPEDIKKYQDVEYYFPHPTWMFRRVILKKLGKYNDAVCAEDYDFTCRALLNGINLYVLDEYLLYYRVRKSSVSNSNMLKQYLISDIISNEYRLSIENNGRGYDPYKKIEKINIGPKDEEKFIKANEYFIKNYNGTKINRIIVMIICGIKSPKSFALNLKKSGIGRKLVVIFK